LIPSFNVSRLYRNLDLSNYVITKQNEDPVYDLFAVSVSFLFSFSLFLFSVVYRLSRRHIISSMKTIRIILEAWEEDIVISLFSCFSVLSFDAKGRRGANPNPKYKQPDTACARNEEVGEWFYFDDSSVKLVDASAAKVFIPYDSFVLNLRELTEKIQRPALPMFCFINDANRNNLLFLLSSFSFFFFFASSVFFQVFRT